MMRRTKPNHKHTTPSVFSMTYDKSYQNKQELKVRNTLAAAKPHLYINNRSVMRTNAVLLECPGQYLCYADVSTPFIWKQRSICWRLHSNETSFYTCRSILWVNETVFSSYGQNLIKHLLKTMQFEFFPIQVIFRLHLPDVSSEGESS